MSIFQGVAILCVFASLLAVPVRAQHLAFAPAASMKMARYGEAWQGLAQGPPLSFTSAATGDGEATASSCQMLRIRRKRTRTTLIVVGSASAVMLGASLLYAAGNASISGSGGDSGLASAGLTFGFLGMVGSGVVYAIEIPRLSRKYNRCRRQ